MKTFNEWMTIQEGLPDKKSKPSIFTRTYYDVPTPEQLEEFKDYPDLSADEIIDGFSYTIIGRGVTSPDNQRKIIKSIEMLVERYPEREEYEEALNKVKLLA